MASLLQHAGQAPQGVASTEESTNAQDQGNNSFEAFSQGAFEAVPATGEDSNAFNDSGFFEDEPPYAPGSDYKDFLLYPDNLPEIDIDTDKFYADADASTKADAGSFYSDTDGSATQTESRIFVKSQPTIQDEDTLFTDVVREAVCASVNEAVYEAIKDFEVRSHPEYTPPPAIENTATDPLHWWICTFHRHECCAYQFEQPPYPIRESEQH